MGSLNQALEHAKHFWVGLSRKQQMLLLAGVVLTLVTLLVFTNLIAKPEYKPLFAGLEPNDAQTFAARLAAKNIAYEISSDGKTLSVPADKIDSTRLEMAAEGMPRSGRLGFELFDKLNWGQTEFDEKVNYQRALEGELERTIQTLQDVESVRVHLVMAADSVFIDREREAKASVILKLRSGRMSEQMQLAIARLVCGAVEKLTPENVTVIDADTNRPLAEPRHGSLLASQEAEQQLTERLVSTLEPVVGPNRLHASVTVEYDPSSTEEHQESYDPNTTVALTMQRSEEQAGSSATVGGIAGTSSNVPGTAAKPKATPAAPEAPSQFSKTESGTYAVNKVLRHTVQPAGRIRRITAALVVDDAVDIKQENGSRTVLRRKRSPDELKQIEELAKAAIGLDTTRGDSVAVQNLAFEQPVADAPAKPTLSQRGRLILNDWSGLIRYAALLVLFVLVYLLLLHPLKKQMLASLRTRPAANSAPLQGGANPPAFALDPSVLPEDRQRALALKQQLVEKVKSEPAPSSRLVQAWLREDQ